jgi:hypothetical protein
MSLRFSVTLVAGATIGVSALAQTHTQTTISIDSLAVVETIAAYCERIDPVNSSQYRKQLSTFTSGHSEVEIEGDQKGKTFANDVAAVNSQLAKVPLATGLSACRSLVVKK